MLHVVKLIFVFYYNYIEVDITHLSEAWLVHTYHYDDPIYSTVQRLPLDRSVVVTVKRSNTKTTNKRKWPILPSTSRLDDLLPPKKLKRK